MASNILSDKFVETQCLFYKSTLDMYRRVQIISPSIRAQSEIERLTLKIQQLEKTLGDRCNSI
jgi:hypothetical protein